MKRSIITTAAIITLLSVVSGQKDGGLSDGAGLSPDGGAGLSPDGGAGLSPDESEGFGGGSKCEYIEIIIFYAIIVNLALNQDSRPKLTLYIR